MATLYGCAAPSLESAAAPLEAQKLFPLPGSFLGFVQFRFPGNQHKIVTTLDLVRLSAYEDEPDPLIGYLTLHMGKYRSHEYLPQYYEMAEHDWSRPELSLNSGAKTFTAGNKHNGPDLSLRNATVSDDGRFIEGEVHTIKGGKVQGTAKLYYIDDWDPAQKTLPPEIDAMFPGVPVLSTITGEYFANQCEDGKKRILQIEAVRESSWESQTSKFMEGYVIRGRIGLAPERRKDSTFDFVSEKVFQGATFNFYQEYFDAPGLHCKVVPTGLDCNNGCMFTKSHAKDRLSELLEGTAIYSRPPTYKCDAVPKDFELTFPYQPADMAGNYVGSVHMEGRDDYEEITLEISGSKLFNNNHRAVSHPTISATGGVYVGGKHTRLTNFIKFEFEPIWLPDHPVKEVTIIGHRDALVRITSWNQQGLGGWFYSRSYGKVGAIQLVKGDLFADAFAAMKFSPPLEGQYRRKDIRGLPSQKLVIDLTTDDGGNVPATVFPFLIHGPHTEKDLLGHRGTSIYRDNFIQSGVFNIFTGTLSLNGITQLHDQFFLMGKFAQGQPLLNTSGWLQKPGHGIQYHSFLPFDRVDE